MTTADIGDGLLRRIVALDTASHEVTRAERALYDAMIARDYAALERILDPDLVYGHSTAVAEDKRQYLDGVRRGLYEYAAIDSRERRVRVAGDVALIDGICDMTVGETSKPKDAIHLMFVLAWRRAGGDWRLWHRHATRIAAAAVSRSASP
jgi:ketosteroid isomerase-like protein